MQNFYFKSFTSFSLLMKKKKVNLFCIFHLKQWGANFARKKQKYVNKKKKSRRKKAEIDKVHTILTKL